ncbi:hypothetical protein N798_05530 [Knoellia flava TL1]|uniref:Uncharacterized protein n=2 Tax=Knoellia flava TaxID=913969 RepID=A0A8H9KQL7_9MICO|nr:hypothetical protein [Knoellia flava]KGN33606.1 hypothetical protein N798_05530 [Knoellia flava TL1]GGB74323.1 hypothetical protein GCM10011314_12230 [Knoellia flava]
MWQLIVGFVVVVALLAWVLHRRGNSGLSGSPARDSVEGSLGSSRHEGYGGGFGGTNP